MSFATWLTFLIASCTVSISPGAGAVAAMTSGLRNGFPYGAWTALGQQAGLVLQILVCGVGLGAVLATSEAAFAIVRWFGVGYLFWLGIQQWRTAGHEGLATGEATPPEARQRMFVRGFLVDASNPKATVFLLAVLPQFIDSAHALVPQYAIISLTLVGVDVIVMGIYVLLASKLLAFWRQPRHLARLHRGFGVLFVGAAILLATFRRQ